LRHYGDDQLLPTTPGRLTLNSGYRPLGGFVLRMNLDGKNCELWAGGTRNIYCIDFNRDGELFGVDNDNESDVGTSWYEPCRLLQCVSGGDYGYREGPANFPDYYDDILPSVARLGLGAPTGVKFAPENCAFPSDYSDACFVEDWAYGRLMAIHLTERGASYSGRVETILRGHPLNLTGLQFGADGALYFITGGRDSPSGLYRLTYVGPRNGKKEGAAKDSSPVAARRLRRRLEALNGPPSDGAVDFVWPCLNSPDRWIRYAARVALEAQGVASWKERALAETNVNGALTALLALARCGRMKDQAECLAALDRFPLGVLNDEQKLAKLRVLEVSFARHGKPDEGAVEREIEQLRPYFPAGDIDLNHELSQLMLYLDAPNAVSNTVRLLKRAVTREDQLYYIMRLRTITRGWMPETRQACQTWFADPRAKPPRAENRRNFQDLNLPYADGIGVSAYLDDFRSELAAASGLSTSGLPPITRELGDDVVSRQPSATLAFVKNWTLAELGSKIDAANSKRSLSRGKAAFVNGQCALCHRFNGVGGVAGPDLTAVSSRMTALQILRSILEPSRTISDAYKNTLLFLTNGDVVCGRVVERTADKLTLMTGLIHQTTIEIKTQDIQSQRLSNVSPMPESLLNSMTENEIWDLLNYLRFGAAAPSAAARD
jgi:putative heme-binding domain-containing protein